MAAPLICTRMFTKTLVSRSVFSILRQRSISRVLYVSRYSTAVSCTGSTAHLVPCHYYSSRSSAGDSGSDSDRDKPRRSKKDDVSKVEPGRAIRAKRDAKVQQQKEQPGPTEGLDEKLVSAVDQVTKIFPAAEQEKTRSDLLQKLQQHSTVTDSQQTSLNISSLFAGLRVDQRSTGSNVRRPTDRRTALRDDGGIDENGLPVDGRPAGTGARGGGRFGRRQQTGDGETESFGRTSRGGVMESLLQRKTRKPMPSDTRKLFEGPALGIFSPKPASQGAEVTSTDKLSLFDVIEREETVKQITRPADNAFDEMIRWTRQGKLWKFPIDNEQGLDEEAAVGFDEHVFVEQYIDDRFPARGPIRHFMELVAVGLSKNAFFTAAEKRGHVDWYSEYFKDKYQLVDDTEINKLDAVQK